MLLMSLIDILLCNSENRALKSNEVAIFLYKIQYLDPCSIDLSPFSLAKKFFISLMKLKL